ncbi:hypothetical protein ACWDOR_31545 [Streptosporangium canum]|uniref:hypothetical protein n=1 Tax=Streptosporangium canum TaxID=324952 RepID=UPI00379F3835
MCARRFRDRTSRPHGEIVPHAELIQVRARTCTAEILADLGLLDDRRRPAILVWADRRIDASVAGFQTDIRDWLIWLYAGDTRTRQRSDTTLYVYVGFGVVVIFSREFPPSVLPLSAGGVPGPTRM